MSADPLPLIERWPVIVVALTVSILLFLARAFGLMP